MLNIYLVFICVNMYVYVLCCARYGAKIDVLPRQMKSQGEPIRKVLYLVIFLWFFFHANNSLWALFNLRLAFSVKISLRSPCFRTVSRFCHNRLWIQQPFFLHFGMRSHISGSYIESLICGGKLMTRMLFLKWVRYSCVILRSGVQSETEKRSQLKMDGITKWRYTNLDSSIKGPICLGKLTVS